MVQSRETFLYLQFICLFFLRQQQQNKNLIVVSQVHPMYISRVNDNEPFDHLVIDSGAFCKSIVWIAIDGCEIKKTLSMAY